LGPTFHHHDYYYYYYYYYTIYKAPSVEKHESERCDGAEPS